MAESSKKNKKKGFKGATLSLGEFQSTPSPSEPTSAPTNWADQVEGFEEERRDYHQDDRRESGRSDRTWDRNESSSDRYSDRPPRRNFEEREPREPREPRPIREQNALPDAPPYTAYVGNLPYDTNDEEINEFFSQNCNVKSSRIVNDRETGKSKGFSYVEFHDRESLEQALQFNTVTFKGRALRVDVATARPTEERRGRSDQAWVRQDRLPLDDRRDNRSSDRGDHGFRRGGFGGDRGDRGGRFGDRDRFGGDRFSDRGGDRFGGDRFGDRGGDRSGDRFGDRGGRFGDRSDRFGDRGGDRFGDRGDRFGDRGNRSGDDQRPEEPVERPAPKPRTSNPFGDAKPRDETKYSRPEADNRSRFETAPSTKPVNPPSAAAANDAPWPRGVNPEAKKTERQSQPRHNAPKNQPAKAAKGKTDATNLFDSLPEERT